MTLISAKFVGITTPAPELHQQIANFGWEVGKVSWDKSQDKFVAQGRNPHGEQIEKTGPDDKTALANLLAAVARHTYMRTAAQHKVGMWKSMFTDQLQPIAEAYAKAPVYDAKAAACFKELADDSVRRAEALHHQLVIEVVDDPEPYPNAQAMADDIHTKKHFLVSRANSVHPVWTVDQIVAFRIVHDVLGHAVSGGDFGWQGENLACAAHFPLLSATAQQALFTECIGQTAYAAFYRSFGPQKVVLFPEFTDPTQAAENQAGHTGVHPSQVTAPTAMPDIGKTPSDDAVSPYPDGYVAPHQEALGLTRVMTKVAGSAFTDPNAGWSSGIEPMELQTHGVGNAYLDHGDPLQSQDVMDNASLVDTKWHQLKNGDGSLNRDLAKQAIVNAFRVVLLSPRKDLRWNAIHYQDISHIPASTDDPKTYWDTLESKRRAWNQSQGIDPLAHMIYFKYLKPFEAVIYQMHPELGPEGAKKKAESVMFDWWSEEQTRIEDEDAQKPSDKQRGADEIERRANEALAKRLQAFLKDKTNPATDVHEAPEAMSLFGKTADVATLGDDMDTTAWWQKRWEYPIPQNLVRFYNERALPGLLQAMDTHIQLAHSPADLEAIIQDFIQKAKAAKVYDHNIEDALMEWLRYHELLSPGEEGKLGRLAAGGQYNLLTGQEGLKYGAFMGTHLKAISQVSQHADEILDAALEDVNKHDATGHHFRAKVLQLGVSGVGPKVCSFAWLLLQPMTSQLATIDTHMMDVLGHNYEKEMGNRDYFKFERELAAGRDAAGYSHVPLGAFQWGMWDHKRTGMGSHQDHSAMRVLDPAPHQTIDWVSKVQPIGGGHAEAFKASWKDNAPDWWRNTQPARDSVAQDWDENVAPHFPRGSIPYNVEAAPTLAKLAAEGSVDEFHVAVGLPKDLALKLSQVAEGIEMEQEKPENYHMTLFWSEKGYERKELHEWIRRSSLSGFHFQNARIDSFPSDDRFAVVLRLDSDAAKDYANRMMDEAEENGLEIKRFDGGFKAHITLGWSDEKVESSKHPEIDFRSKGLYVSVPRPLRKQAVVEELSGMALLRSQHPGLSTPEIWALEASS